MINSDNFIDIEKTLLKMLIYRPDFTNRETKEKFNYSFCLTDPLNNKNDRSNYEYAKGHITDAVNISPHDVFNGNSIACEEPANFVKDVQRVDLERPLRVILEFFAFRFVFCSTRKQWQS